MRRKEMTGFFRFPHTPHIAWLSEGAPRDDKVLSPDEANMFLDGDLVVEEKIDGANLGFSIGPEGSLLAQNRGGYLDPQTAHPQFRPLWSWLAVHEDDLFDALYPDRILFGEWCVATHSIPYDALPDWFLAFDVYERGVARFWDTRRRNELAQRLEIATVPRIAQGRFTLDALKALFGPSRVGSATMEGIVVRREADGWTEGRAKLVRPHFVQGIETHWSRGPMKRNALRGTLSA